MDQTQASFRQSLIAIVFAGVYFDALLYIAIRDRFGKGAFERLEKQRGEKGDRRPRYIIQLEKLEITDSETLADCGRFNTARNDIVHEKAVEIMEAKKVVIAQTEAEHAISFVHRIGNLLEAHTF
jgi:hypothetical protein